MKYLLYYSYLVSLCRKNDILVSSLTDQIFPMWGIAFTAFMAPRLRQALCLTIRSLSFRSPISLSTTRSSVQPVLPREMAATARTLGSMSSSNTNRASTTAEFWKAAGGRRRRGGRGGGGGRGGEGEGERRGGGGGGGEEEEERERRRKDCQR